MDDAGVIAPPRDPAAIVSASEPRRRWRDRVTPSSADASSASLDPESNPDAAPPRFRRRVTAEASSSGGAPVESVPEAPSKQSPQARAHGRHPRATEASAVRPAAARALVVSASSSFESSSSSRKGTSSETARKSAVPMTSSLVVRCSWYTDMHWRRMCRRALRTATCTLTSGRVRPSLCSKKPVVVPFTASVSTTTTPVHSSAMGPTFRSAYDASPSLTASASARPTAPLSPPHQHTAASAKVSPYPRLVKMGNNKTITAARAKSTSKYTIRLYPKSDAFSVPLSVLSLVVLAMITPVNMNRTVFATNVSISQKWCSERSVSPVKNPRPNAPMETPSTTTARTPEASLWNSATRKHR